MERGGAFAFREPRKKTFRRLEGDKRHGSTEVRGSGETKCGEGTSGNVAEWGCCGRGVKVAASSVVSRDTRSAEGKRASISVWTEGGCAERRDNLKKGWEPPTQPKGGETQRVGPRGGDWGDYAVQSDFKKLRL